MDRNIVKLLFDLLPVIIMVLIFSGRFRNKVKKETKKESRYDNQKSVADIFWETLTEKEDKKTIELEKLDKTKANETANNLKMGNASLIPEKISSNSDYVEMDRIKATPYENMKDYNSKEYTFNQKEDAENNKKSSIEEKSSPIEIDLKEDVLKGIIMSHILEDPKSRKYFDGSFPN